MVDASAGSPGLPATSPPLGAHTLIGGVLFDFGGTLDADGLTWKTRFFRLCREEGLVADPERFDPVFHAADDALVGAIPATLPFRDTIHRLAAGVTRAPLPRLTATTLTSAAARLPEFMIGMATATELSGQIEYATGPSPSRTPREADFLLHR